jgi:hypothetical protein
MMDVACPQILMIYFHRNYEFDKIKHDTKVKQFTEGMTLVLCPPTHNYHVQYT